MEENEKSRICIDPEYYIQVIVFAIFTNHNTIIIIWKNDMIIQGPEIPF